jgi:hypothetical protein
MPFISPATPDIVRSFHIQQWFSTYCLIVESDCNTVGTFSLHISLEKALFGGFDQIWLLLDVGPVVDLDPAGFWR